MKFKTATFCVKEKENIKKRSKMPTEKCDLWSLDQAWEDSKGSVRSFKAMSPRLRSWITRNSDGTTRTAKQNGSASFHHRRSRRVAHNNTGQRGKPLVLDSSCVHLGSQQRLLPMGTKGSHTQSNVKRRGGREDWSQREEAKTKTCFIAVVNLGAAHWKGQGSTLSTTTHILQQSLGENMRQSWHSSAIHL